MGPVGWWPRLRAAHAVALALAATPCAAAECGPWKGNQEASGLGEGFLVGVGAAVGEGPAAAALARQQALAAMSSQVRVHVASELRAEERSVSQAGRVSESQRIQANTRTATALTLEGAEVRAVCSEEGQTFVLMALDRRVYASAAREKLMVKCLELATLDEKAAKASSEGRHLDAAAALSQAAGIAEDVEEKAAVARIIARAPLALEHPAASDLRRRAKEEAARTAVLVRVEPGSASAVLRQAAVSCLAFAGVGVADADAPPGAVLTLTVNLDPPQSALPGIVIVRGTLSAALQVGPSEPVTAGSADRVKGGGESPEAASRDALRRLGTERLPKVIDELFKSGGWQLRACADRKP